MDPTVPSGEKSFRKTIGAPAAIAEKGTQLS